METRSGLYVWSYRLDFDTSYKGWKQGQTFSEWNREAHFDTSYKGWKLADGERGAEVYTEFRYFL